MKKCRLGKSCGATCISRLKECLIDLIDPVSGALGKVVKLVSKVTRPLKVAAFNTLQSAFPILTVGLSRIYRRNGFNAKPELVPNRDALEKRKDIVTHPDGKPLILFRGVSDAAFMDQFKGKGEKGGTHFPGKGIHGNGTYAVARGLANRLGSDAQSIQTAIAYSRTPEENAAMKKRREETGSYSGVFPNSRFNNRVAAFAFKNGSNLLIETADDSWEWSKFEKSLTARATKKFGYRFNDVGEAAAALGIDAYRVPGGNNRITGVMDEDYWVIFNRGALVVADDPQL